MGGVRTPKEVCMDKTAALASLIFLHHTEKLYDESGGEVQDDSQLIFRAKSVARRQWIPQKQGEQHQLDRWAGEGCAGG